MDEACPQRQRAVGPLLRLSQHQQVALAGEGFAPPLDDLRRQLERGGYIGQRELLTDDAGGLQHLPFVVGHLLQLLADQFPQAGGEERRQIRRRTGELPLVAGRLRNCARRTSPGPSSPERFSPGCVERLPSMHAAVGRRMRSFHAAAVHITQVRDGDYDLHVTHVADTNSGILNGYVRTVTQHSRRVDDRLARAQDRAARRPADLLNQRGR